MSRFNIQRFDYGAPPKDAAWDLLSPEEQQKALVEWEAQQNFIELKEPQPQQWGSAEKKFVGIAFVLIAGTLVLSVVGKVQRVKRLMGKGNQPKKGAAAKALHRRQSLADIGNLTGLF
jgi:hypothetical protein